MAQEERPQPPPSLAERIAHNHPHLIPYKMCQQLAMREGSIYLLTATAGTFAIAKLARVSPNNAILSAAVAGIGAGFFATALQFHACTAILSRRVEDEFPEERNE
ncbi:hypothetical protein BC828DRAFT_402386 [Blastocladiella britannica]|nr:hypothetical protein BC828DRAFT_402386 [Blastocladiella britannica]